MFIEDDKVTLKSARNIWGSEISETIRTIKEDLGRDDVEVLPQFRALWGEEIEELRRLGVELFIPLKAQDELVGIFAVGPKLSEVTFSFDDQLTLTTLANQTATAIEKARLYEAAQQELTQRERAEREIRRPSPRRWKERSC